MISFIVPAHNEEACLAPTLQAIHKSARATGLPYEIMVITIVLLTNPFFDFLPQLKTLIGGSLDDVRFAVNILLAHVFLALWPCTGFLLRSLFQQTRWLERIKLVGLIALCLWLAWLVTGVVMWFWPWLYQKAI